MTIEWLRYDVPQEHRDRFLQADAETWTATLAQQAGFIGKQTWVHAQTPTELHLVIQWQTREHWKAVPADVLLKTHEAFVQKAGYDFKLLGVLEYEVL